MVYARERMEESTRDSNVTITTPKPRPNFGDWVELFSYPILGLGTSVIVVIIIGLIVLVPFLFINLDPSFIGYLERNARNIEAISRSETVQSLFLALSAIINVLFLTPVFYIGFTLKRFSWKSFGLDKITIKWKVVLESLAVVVVANGLEMLIEYLQELWHFRLPEFNKASLEALMPSNRSILLFIVFFLVIGIIGPICEEIFFRGAIYGWFRRYYKPWIGILVSSLFFGVLHYETLLRMIFAISIGAYMAWMYERDKTLTSPMTLHILNNSIVVLLMFFFPNL